MPSYERRNDGKHRSAVFERDKGSCQICRLSLIALAAYLFPRYPVTQARLDALNNHPWAAKAYRIDDLWQMDHRLPVIFGGALGDSGDLSLLRVLCIPCHKEETKKLKGQLSRLPKKRYKNLK